MFAAVSRLGLRAAPSAAAPIARRQASTVASHPKIPQGSEEFMPFMKRPPVDVYPLVFVVVAACCGSVYMCYHHLTTDKSLRLKPSGSAGTHH